MAPGRPARQEAQTAAGQEQANLARAQAEQITLERRRKLYGWSQHGIDTFPVELVTSAAEMDRARTLLRHDPGSPGPYVILRMVVDQVAHRGADGRHPVLVAHVTAR